MKLEVVSIKRTPQLTERWVQDTIANDPSILSLEIWSFGIASGRRINAGRLDLLLQDPDTLKRFEVEIQLAPPTRATLFARSNIGTLSGSGIPSTSMPR